MTIHQCPKCNTEFSVGTKFCQNCGCNLENEFTETPTCPKCGKIFTMGTKFCDVDGSKLVSPERLIPRCVKYEKESTSTGQHFLETEIPIDIIRIIVFILGTLSLIIVAWIVLRFLFPPVLSFTALNKAILGPLTAFILYLKNKVLLWVVIVLIFWGVVKFLDRKYLDINEKSQLAKVGLFFSSIAGGAVSCFFALWLLYLAKAVFGF